MISSMVHPPTSDMIPTEQEVDSGTVKVTETSLNQTCTKDHLLHSLSKKEDEIGCTITGYMVDRHELNQVKEETGTIPVSDTTSADLLCPTTINDSDALIRCPICEELRDDVEVLDHWDVVGDISDHKMCGACRGCYTHSQCPFCREVLCKEEFITFIHFFVNFFVSNLSGTDYNLMTATFEHWQVLELQLDGNIMVLNRIGKRIIENDIFITALRSAVFEQQQKLRYISGIIFRFWSLLRDSGLELRPEESELLEEAVEFIVKPLEESRPVKLNGGKNYATLYMQALVPLLSARNSGCLTANFVYLVKRIGNTIINYYNNFSHHPEMRREISNGMHTEYLAVAHEVVWGSKAQDLIWITFVKDDEPASGNSSDYRLNARVMTRCNRGAVYHLGTIIRVHNKTNLYDIAYDDGDIERYVTYNLIQPLAPTSLLSQDSFRSTGAGGHSTPALSRRDELRARRRAMLENYNSVNDRSSAHSGVELSELFERVEARYIGDAKYYPGVIVKVCKNINHYDIDYDDGNHAFSVNSVYIRPGRATTRAVSRTGSTSTSTLVAGGGILHTLAAYISRTLRGHRR